MKNLISVILLMFIASINAIAQQDSTITVNAIDSFTSNSELLGTIVAILTFIIGHFFVKGKWYSFLHYAEIILKWLYEVLKSINEKTNKK